MELNLNGFIADVNKEGMLLENKFLVTFGAPNYLTNSNSPIAKYKSIYNHRELLTLRCEAAVVPGLQFAGIDGPPRLGYGTIEFHPYNVVYDDIILTLALDAKGTVHKFFYDWLNCIVNFQAQGQSRLRDDNLGPVSGMVPYEVGYKDDYSTNLLIDIYTGVEADHKSAITVKAYKAFPKAITPLYLNWESGQPIKIQLSMAYTDFDITYNSFP